MTNQDVEGLDFKWPTFDPLTVLTKDGKGGYYKSCVTDYVPFKQYLKNHEYGFAIHRDVSPMNWGLSITEMSTGLTFTKINFQAPSIPAAISAIGYMIQIHGEDKLLAFLKAAPLLTLKGNKMSLEQALQENTAAVLKLTEILARGETPAKTPAKTAPTEVPAKTPAKVAPAVDYKKVTDALAALVTAKDASAVKTLLQEFGAKSGKDLKQEQYAEVIAKADALAVLAEDEVIF
jgi:hypothetical protein